MPGPAIDAYLYLLNRAFDTGEHSFLRNLEGTPPEQWNAIVPGQPFGRSIGYIAWHTAAGKELYWDHAFGARKLTGGYTSEGVTSPHRSFDEVVAHARTWHQKWLERVAALDDSDLQGLTTAHWGTPISMRRAIAAMVEHDLYHSGEINHLRAILNGTDKAPGA